MVEYESVINWESDWLSASQWLIERVTVVEYESVINLESDWLSTSQWVTERVTVFDYESVIHWGSNSGWVAAIDSLR